MSLPPAIPKVLVVEDEPLLRMLAVDVFKEAGLEVLEAGTAHDAIALLEAHPDAVAVFTDIDMPGTIDGIELAHKVTREWPPVAVIVTSGYPPPDIQVLPPEAVFVPKPYDLYELVDRVRGIALRRGRG